MSDTKDPPERFSLSRWSKRKHEVAREKASPPEAAPPAPAAPPVAAVPPAPAVEPAAPLPPVESLTIDSDFTPFLSPKVSEVTRRAALRKLFSDPRFNVQDGLDIYIGDYTKPDPMPEGMLDKLADVYKTLTEEVPEPSPESVAETVGPGQAAQPEEALPLVAEASPPAKPDEETPTS